jgi:hypothetical protein
MKINLIIDGKNIFNRIFIPLARRMGKELIKFGFDVSYENYSKNTEALNLIFGAHSSPIYWSSLDCETVIFVNCEPLYDQNWRQSNSHYMSLLAKSRVLEVYDCNFRWGYEVEKLVLPPLFEELGSHNDTPQMNKINLKDQFLFVGSMNEKRIKFIDELRSHDMKVDCRFGVFDFELRSAIASSRFFLNLDFYEDALFNKYRLALCLGSDSIFVGERGVLSDGLDEGLCVHLPMLRPGVTATEIIDFARDPCRVGLALEGQARVNDSLSLMFSKKLCCAFERWV